MRAGDGTLAAWHDGIERLFRERGPVFGRLCRFDRRSGTGIPLAGMTAFPGLCDRTLYGQADAGQVGSKVVQVKGVMLLSQHTPGKHRPAKPSGDSGLNTLLAGREESGAGRAKRCKENADCGLFYEYRRREGIGGQGKETAYRRLYGERAGRAGR